MNFLINYEEVTSMILFAIGFTMLVFSKNIMKKILGLNIMDTGRSEEHTSELQSR